MVRFLAAVVVVGGAVLVGGLCIPYSFRQNAIVAQSNVVPQPSSDQVSQTASTLESHSHPVALRGHQTASSSRNESPFAESDSVTAVDEAAPANRFDRGRLGEEFDGQIFQGSSRATSSVEDSIGLEDGPVIPAAQGVPQLAVKESPKLRSSEFGEPSDFSVASSPIPKKSASTPDQARHGGLIPSSPQGRTRPALPSDRHFSELQQLDAAEADPFSSGVAAPAPPVLAAQTPRVTLIRTSDHQIRIVAEKKSGPQVSQSLPAGAISITAEEFSLTLPTQPGTGNQLSCSGRVEIRGQQFTALCTKLSVKNSDLVMEGTSDHPAEIIKLSPTVEHAEAVKTDGSEFRLSARQISFSLSLDAIKVSNSISILPVEPNPPALNDAALPTDAGELEQPIATDAPPAPIAVDPVNKN